jgi:hypothetical protein
MYVMENWCREHKIKITPEQVIAAKYLRSRGARFMIDYGYENSTQSADALFDLECEKALEVGLIQ